MWKGSLPVRNKKTRLIVPFLALAISAVFGVAGASAETQILWGLAGEESSDPAQQPRFGTDDSNHYPISLDGGASNIEFQFPNSGEGVSCSGAPWSWDQIAAETKQVSFTLTNSSCSAGSWPTAYDFQGCSLRINALNVGPPYEGSIDLVCPPGSAVVFTKGTPTVKCVWTIQSQNGIGTTDLENYNGGVRFSSFELGDFTYHQNAGTGWGACTSSGYFSDGTASVYSWENPGTFDVNGYH
jgi:hypothetical protein